MIWKIKQVLTTEEVAAFLGTLSASATMQAKIINVAFGFKIIYPEIPVATGGSISGSMSIPNIGTINLTGKLP